jgi:very-short-patch-repair endonuclease
MCGVKFRRQHAISRFIVDFYAPQARLVIEVDGGIHTRRQEEDAVRQAYLENLNVRVLRFANEQVLNEIEIVLARIADVLQEA